MAIVKYGAGVADMRNKINGAVASRNQYGAYWRTKVTPINPQTTAQSNQRTVVSTLSKYWGGTLTEAQRNSWIAAAQFMPVMSIFGDVQILNGNALFMRINNLLLRLGQSIIATAPAALTVGGLTSCVLTATNAGSILTIAIAPTPVPAATRLVVFAAASAPPGRTFFKSSFRLLTSFAAAAASPYDISAAYVAMFGTFPVAGKKVAVKCFNISTANGGVSVPFQSIAIVT